MKVIGLDGWLLVNMDQDGLEFTDREEGARLRSGMDAERAVALYVDEDDPDAKKLVLTGSGDVWRLGHWGSLAPGEYHGRRWLMRDEDLDPEVFSEIVTTRWTAEDLARRAIRFERLIAMNNREAAELRAAEQKAQEGRK